MINKIKNRMASEQGFTLIELLVVIIILGILVAIAVPAYLSFTSSAHSAAAESNVRSAVPAAEDYYETNGTYTGMSYSAMAALSPGIDTGITVVVGQSTGTSPVPAAGDSYCLSDTSGTGASYHYVGGAAASDGKDAADAKVIPGTCASVSW